MSLVSWNLSNKRGGASNEQASKKQAGGSEKFLMKGTQVLQKLSLKHAMEIRELQAAVLKTVVMNQDDPIVKVARVPQETARRRRYTTRATALDGYAGGSSQSKHGLRRREYAEYPPVLPGIRKCRGHGNSDPCVPVKKALQKGKVKVCFAVHASAEQVLKLLVDKLTDKGGEVKRGQAPKKRP